MDKRDLEEFLSLPINKDETWQGGAVSLADVFDVPDADDRVALALWRSVSTELVHAEPAASFELSRRDVALEALIGFSDEHEFPFRPARIEYNDAEVAEALNRILDGSGTEVRFVGRIARVERDAG